MKICINGIIREMTAEEEAQYNEMAARAAAEAKHRPLSENEVLSMLITAQINTLSVDDATAVRMTAFYPGWEKDTAYTVGYKVKYLGKLYKVIQAHTSQETWTPDITASLYTRIDEVHDGTKYDPIPYEGNMTLYNGKYYIEDGVTYLCNRDTGNPVYNKLSELVGIYVEVVSI
nr:MAG TPA: Chitin oligosaccharide deacetylase [Caudoviricetes sp.]